MALPQLNDPVGPAIEICSDAGGGLDITWTDGHQSFFHHIGLRDCCHCYSSERFLMPCDFDLKVRPASVDIAPDGKLKITWGSDNHQSLYDPVWPRQNSYDAETRQARRHQPTLWDSAVSSDFPSVDYQSAADNDATRLNLIPQDTVRHGAMFQEAETATNVLRPT